MNISTPDGDGSEEAHKRMDAPTKYLPLPILPPGPLFDMVYHGYLVLGLLSLAGSSVATSPRVLKGRSTAVNPVVASATVLGLVESPGVTRDSCNSVHWGNRALWTCRDTQPVVNGQATLPVVSTTAAWANFNADGTPGLAVTGAINTPFYPLQADECGSNTAGACSDGTRWAIWQDSAIMTTLAFPNGDVGGYTWIMDQHISGDLSVLNNPAPASLYRVNYQPDRDGSGLPQAQLVTENFWSSTDVPFGVYGNVVQGDTAYLYGSLSNGGIALAKVPITGVESQSNYQYYVNGAWTTTKPKRTDSIAISNVSAGGQGTYYYSSLWSSYVWIGGSIFPGAAFYITTAPAPQGPWTQPQNFYNGHQGNQGLQAYSLQAHPGLTDGSGKDIYISFTNITSATNGNTLYATPLIHVVWG